MTHQVRIEPSGHTFTALPEESLLEAALRSGVNVKYSCNNGTCGECMVRLREGEVELLQQPGYRFTTQERNEGFILMCSNRAAGDLVIEAQEALSPADIPLQQLSAKVAKVEQPSEHVRILHLRTPRTKSLRFMAGQHVCLTLPGIGSYDAAIASCPCNGTNLQFHLPHDPGDPFLNTAMHVGQKVELSGPYGDISLNADSERPLLMLAEGTDIATIKSLIEHAINLDLRQPLRLVWLASQDEGHYLENHCRAWGEVLDDYTYVTLEMAGCEPGREELAQLRRTVAQQLEPLDAADVYVAGSRLFREVVREHLMTLGVPGERIFAFQRRVAPRLEKREQVKNSLFNHA